MPLWKGEKWACYACMRGHRSSKCSHTDRILYKVRKPGRPLNNCPHKLPDSLPAGTFVNSSLESMANGGPSKEACICKDELVQVAIPKSKSCSCLTQETVSAVPPSPRQPERTEAWGKKTRISKRSSRRKKSSVSEEAVVIAMAEVARTDPARAEALGGVEESKAAKPVFGQQNIDFGYIQPNNTPAGLRQSFGRNISGENTNWHSGNINPALLPPTVDHHSEGGNVFPVNLTAPGLSPVYVQAAPSFMEPAQKPQPPFFDHSTSSQHVPLLQEPLAQFHTAIPTFDRMLGLNLPLDVKVNGHDKFAPRTALTGPPQKLNEAECYVTTNLSIQEWALIQKMRACRIDLAEISRAVSRIKDDVAFNPLNHVGCASGGTAESPSSSANSPFTSASSSVNSPPSANGTIGECCTNKAKSPRPIPLNPPPTQGSSCCGNRQGNRSEPALELSTGPASPRCKCGDACRCVPCADHPRNPAMLARIEEEMEQMGEPNDLYELGLVPFLPEGGSGVLSFNGYYEEEEESHEDTGGDLTNFVIFDYKYGSGCSVGIGGCKCGEGCQCVGCFTHNGHNGLLLEGGHGDIGGAGPRAGSRES